MKYRNLGSTGMLVSEIGFGAWGIGGATPGSTSYGHTDDSVSLNALACSLESGINFYDTSNVYGYGHSEILLGRAFANRRSDVIIATKAGFLDYESAPDFSAESVSASVNASLKRLGSDYIDLLQLHNPSADWLALHPETLEALVKLKRNGKIRAIGVSVKGPGDAFELLEVFPFEVIQANFNMLDLRALECGLMDKLYSKGVGFIARTPMSFGFLSGALTGNETFPQEDHRSRWSREQILLWVSGARDLHACCTEESNISPPHELALRFCLSYDQVSTTIPGMLTADEVEANSLASVRGPLSRESRARIEALHGSRSFVAK
jgi:aryl-alcohol dehydrogenase-like predicted oxidoreductase